MATSPKRLEDLPIALVHDSLTVPAGGEKVLKQFHTLVPQAPIYTPLYKPEKFPEYKDVRVHTSSLNRWSYARNHHQLMIPLLPYFVEQFDLSAYDVVLSDSSAVAKGVLTRPETIHVCYCHTPMRWAWMPYLDARSSSSFIRRLAAHYLRLWDSATTSRVDYWLANSQTTAGRIKKFYGREAAVIYPPVDVSHIEPVTENDGYFLSVGRLVYQKRIDVIIEAAKESGIQVKIAGDGPERKALEKLAAGAKNIEFLGFVTDEERNKLYAGCRAFLFVSEEDSGIVPIEAMAYGKPVLAYGRGGGSETVQDGKTGVHFQAQTATSLGEALEKMETLSFDAQAIARHAQQFSTERFQQEITAYLNKVLTA